MVEVRALGESVGAEILGADAATLSPAAFAVIYRAFLDHHVVVLRNQRLEIPGFLGYAARYGSLRPHMNTNARHPEVPELMLLDNHATGKTDKPTVLTKRGVGWHSDLGYETEPAKATALYAITIPSRGGDTLFSNMHLAYEDLSEDLKVRIEGKTATFRYGGRTDFNLGLLAKEDRDKRATVRHSIVRVHPETGRRALYISPTQILAIDDLDPSDSDGLIGELESHVAESAGIYRHQWSVGDLVIWDNRCLLHTATGDYPAHERRLHWRTTIMTEQGARVPHSTSTESQTA
jgi:taurine dioxygenase